MRRFKFLSVLAASIALIGLLWTVSDPQTTRTFIAKELPLVIDSVGPHAIGGAAVSGAALTLYGSSVERMRLTDGGILALGTTITTGAMAGDLVLNDTSLRFVNVIGTGTLRAVDRVSSTNEIVIAGDGGDIRWGRALVALGGGAAPTFGTIGGSGPATAAQNSWMRVVDSAGAVFWVPAWK